jgi:dynamin 1-like protein
MCACQQGPRPSLFIPEISFELLVKKQIARLLKPAIDCVDLVFDELKRVAGQCETLSPELRRFPILREKMLGMSGQRAYDQ